MDSSSSVIWARPARATHGPVPSLTRDRIAAVAIELADADGLEAVSMRALAAALGTGAASLYRYVESKDELIDLMADAVMGAAMRFGSPASADGANGGWRAHLRSYARGLRAMVRHHPWMVVEGAGRTSLGPNTAAVFEWVLGGLDGLGLQVDDMLTMVETVDAFTRGRALEEVADQDAVRRSGLDNDAWMRQQEPYVRSLVESGRYPLLSRVILDAEAPHDPERLETAFRRGLELVLEGLASMLAE
jgi:AcrR family transcriptional regulator